ncbi:hypothetical protein E7811_16510 [Aliigemmobacter aestuarii]|uniref:Uncharacterized protein n=2 Tax=Aliigemmobacter aestuarii TaxID=1445661 RepID=A0A4S3MKN7_9RHOB|nr:hypothetical protein E7811_16510 [Gemmobacter aestuarii]
MPAPAPTDAGPESLPLMGGYRAEADPCRRVGEDAFTNQFLDDSADLVACPAGMENMGVFVTETGAVQVAEAAGFVLFSVPRG